MEKALERSQYRQLDDGTWFAEISDFPGVWANAATVEACRRELLEVLEEWLLLKLRDQDPIPVHNPQGKGEISATLLNGYIHYLQRRKDTNGT